MKFIFYSLFIMLFYISCAKTPQFNDPIPEHDTFTINSKQVNEKRVINIWTPTEYKKDSIALPVLYMLDGGLKEDFPHIANTLAELIEAKKIKPIILVGIENTERRRDLTGFTNVEKDKEIAPVVGGSTEFRAFINEELFAQIKKRYKTTNEKGIIGESVAGLFVTETLLEDPDMFDFYIAFDPSLWWNDTFLIRSAKDKLSKFPASQKRFWFAGSKAEDISDNVRNLAKIIETEKLPTLKYQYSDEPKEEHSTIFRATKEKALIWTLGGK